MTSDQNDIKAVTLARLSYGWACCMRAQGEAKYVFSLSFEGGRVVVVHCPTGQIQEKKSLGLGKDSVISQHVQYWTC
jgi:hypothetical protein